MALSAPRTVGWSKLNITLHWLIVLFIIVQLIDHEWMVDMWRASRRGTAIDATTATWGWTHIVVGTLVLIAAAIRLWDRYRHGRPPHPEAEPNWAVWVAKITHFLIYAILIVMPIAGLIAWFAGSHDVGEIHTFFWTPLLILIGLHVLGALAHQFWFKTDVLKRIVKPA
ncbi:cytochrome b [Aurantimonas sp. VKM B-3413]|uniref:cytochrome b n=1 Tax=Aurantimonas sp. VKM B-3413 TaxID=2779401 RepID=UPI001E47F7DD|nr:cytochrome b/b6 domain-containing protein [Aurantimonas sp. VKM B-3413]MCB8837890.1 cytochrome b/b6 domain-containing protein [Aurantimonas sp. VKM B-3413]